MEQRQGARQRSETATLTKRIYTAYLEELSAIADYTYWSIFFGTLDPALSRVFDGIAMTEMAHFRHLGEWLEKNGGSAAVNTRHYTKALSLKQDALSHAATVAARVLADAIADEEAAAKNYRALASGCPDPDTVRLLTTIADEELAHAAALKKAAARER